MIETTETLTASKAVPWRKALAESPGPRKAIASISMILLGFVFSAILPFLAVFYQSNGLDSRKIGVLLAAVPFINTVAPIWTLAADRFHAHFVVWLLSFTIGVVAQVAVYFAARISFPLLAALVVVTSASRAAVWPLNDATALGLVGKAKYGSVRLWMSLIWGVGAISSSVVVSRFGIVWIFVIHAISSPLFFFMAVFIWKFVPLQQEPPEADEGKPSRPVAVAEGFGKKVIRVLRDVRMIGFLLLATGIGIAQAFVAFFQVFLQDQFGTVTSNFWFFGFIVIASISLEVPCFAISNWVINKIGCFPLMLASLMIFAARGIAYTYIPSFWWGIVPELLHGPGFVAMWATGVRTASDLVPEDLQATGQGLFTLTFSSIGNGTGLLLFGLVYRTIGPIWAFRAWSVLCTGLTAISLVIYFSYKLFMRRRSISRQKVPTIEEEEAVAEPPSHEAELQELPKCAK